MILIVFGVVSLIRMGNVENVSRVTALIIALFMFGNAVAMLISGLGLGLRSKWLYLLAVAVIVVNMVFPDCHPPFPLPFKTAGLSTGYNR